MPRIPDPALMERLQFNINSFEWAAALLAGRQHEQPAGEWSAHQHVFHLLRNEHVFHDRIREVLEADRPVFLSWDSEGYMREHYHRDDDITVLAARFTTARAETCEIFSALTPQQWQRTAVWPSGREIDLAWFAEKVLWHALEHLACLLDLHGDLEPLQAPAWLAVED
ncbi:MAG: DinB family protein [Tepidiformaceae bacterium]